MIIWINTKTEVKEIINKTTKTKSNHSKILYLIQTHPIFVGVLKKNENFTKTFFFNSKKCPKTKEGKNHLYETIPPWDMWQTLYQSCW
jgi:hypothetical protein